MKTETSTGTLGIPGALDHCPKSWHRLQATLACPPGGPETAHQIVNAGDVDRRCLVVSTKLGPEIAEYPDSNKFGVLAEFPGEGDKPDVFRFLGRTEESLGYYDDEPEK